jgi:hypothetical protein
MPETGLRQDLCLQRIVVRLRDVEEDFINYTDNQRVNRVCDAVTGELGTLGVPLPTLEIGAFPGLNGQFAFATWTLKVSTELAVIKMMERANTNRKKEIFAKLGDTITHEARHCEQWWRMALLVVTQKWLRDHIKPTATQLQALLGIPLAMCQRAVTSPPLSPLWTPETESWFSSVYGSGSSYRGINAYGRNLRPTAAISVGGREEDIGAMFRGTEFVRYEQGLSEEADAHATGQRIQELYLAGSAVRPVPLFGHQRAAGTF